MYRSFLLIPVILLSLFILHVRPALSATPTCQPIYGGGEGACKPLPTNSVSKKPTSTPTPSPAKKTTTKGGLPVHPPTKAKTTPPTGPETLALIGLIPTAGLGFWLRRKSK